MSAKLTANLRNPPLGGLAVMNLVKDKISVKIIWGNETSLEFPDNNILLCNSDNDVMRSLSRKAANCNLYGSSEIEKIQIDHWLTYSLILDQEIPNCINYLNESIAPITYLVANRLTIADLAIFSSLYKMNETLPFKDYPPHLKRWYNLIKSQECFEYVLKSLPKDVELHTKKSSGKDEVSVTKTNERKQEGKFEVLPGAEIGKVIVRFPPEASGFLHIGHAKAALLNQYYQQTFQGKLIMRFDDTNPAKENAEFEKVILEDLEMLQIKPDLFTHTSQYFDLMLNYCEALIKQNKAYVDNTDAETMKKEREEKIESKNRNNSIEENLVLWKEMIAGSKKGQSCCVRAKIDMMSANGCMRDPTIYRCKSEPHPRTGTKYKVYPTYDFACPIVDAIENVTHTLRTMEYHDRDEQFYWFIDALGLRKPYIWEFSRLNMTNTVLSKRKLTWFVEQGLVDGWDDPRFPTVRGILRRGMTVESLKEFIIAQGSSKSVVFMNWDKIWAFNKKIIDPIAPRYTALEISKHVVVSIENAKSEKFEVALHPKNSDVGTKIVSVGPRILIDYVDAELLKEGENATFINWGNILIKKINKENEKITTIDAALNLDNKDYKKTVKLTWLCELDSDNYPPTYCVYFDHIISKDVLAKDEDFTKYIGHQTRFEVPMLGDPELKKCKKGDIIQLQRRGFFKVDNAYSASSLQSGVESPIVLFSIPDGHTKTSPNIALLKGTIVQENDKKISKDTNSNLEDINLKIKTQGDKVRQLKAQKAPKAQIDESVKNLLTLKAEFKKITGNDWTPDKTVQNKPSQIKKEDMSEKSIEDDLNEKILKQGDNIRTLKANKCEKSKLEEEVKILLDLKSQYKQLSGQEWKPKVQPTKSVECSVKPNVTISKDLNDDITTQITDQGNKIRKLKAEKAEKTIVANEVKLLIELKEKYKKETGKEWTPTQSVPENIEKPKTSNAIEIFNKIKVQGDKIRQLKLEKTDKSAIDKEVNQLLALKKEYKSLTGEDWTPKTVITEIKDQNLINIHKSDEKDIIIKKINNQADLVREMKNKKSIKAEIDIAVKNLIDLKAEYTKITGEVFPVQGKGTKNENSLKRDGPKQTSPKDDAKKSKLEQNKENTIDIKKQTRLGLEATKENNLPEWYSQVITKGELIEYYDVSGCYILRHWSFAIWKTIKNWFDAEITKLGVQECYFPLFVSKNSLEKEKTHVADFSPEVAWVTKSGDSNLAEHIAIRPTSETVMYPTYAKWIQSYRDLPIKLNQWNNVVRWEFKHPQPFLRTREFLWQEGHTAFATQIEAEQEVLTILDLYAKVYTHLLAIPVVKGRKTEKEKFAGGDYTTTVEAFISASGRAIQGATSHHLGQNFSKIFDIVFEDPETKEKRYVYQNSWGLTTRTIGVMIMVHADNQGLVLPPHVACIQVVIVPCGINVSMKDEERKNLLKSCEDLEIELRKAGVRVEGDYRDNYSPGWKFNHWELKGVPIRIEIGPKDIRSHQIVAVRRDTGEKLSLSRDNADDKILKLLETIHDSLLAKAAKDLVDHTKRTKNWTEFCTFLDAKNIILSPFCGSIKCEDNIKNDSVRDADIDPGAPSMGAKSLCIPFDQPIAITLNDKCIHPYCQNKPKFYTLFGRSY